MIYKTYLSICLFPDERSERRAYQASNTFRYLYLYLFLTRSSKRYFSDHNPIFNECFFFQVSPRDMVDRILKVRIAKFVNLCQPMHYAKYKKIRSSDDNR